VTIKGAATRGDAKLARTGPNLWRLTAIALSLIAVGMALALQAVRRRRLKPGAM
jgi:hypothetical protein